MQQCFAKVMKEDERKTERLRFKNSICGRNTYNLIAK
jgi:hypothetical protein